MNFEIDILSEIDWESINIDEIKNLSLQNKRNKEQEIALGLSNEEKELLKETGREEKTGTCAFLAWEVCYIFNLIANY